MAKTIATIGGYALAPGVSKNRRWYTAEHIAGAVQSAQERLARGGEPMVMLSHHAADDDSLRIAAALREVSLTDDGRVRWRADIPDTETGREIAALADTSDGQPAFLEGVSIRGRWTGKVRQVRAPDGQLAEQGTGLALDGLDFTHKPGMPGARIDTFAWAKGGATETSESVLITESVEEARVTTITEDTGPAGQVDEAAQTSAPPGTTYADPGYQADKKKRYPLNNPGRIRSAWSYVNQKDNAAQYTGPQLKRVKGRIKAAMKRIGAKVTAEGWVIWPAEQVTEAALAEHYGGDVAMAADASMAGSFRISATNGPLNVEISSYCVDPADLELILAAAAQSASDAMKGIDPDMDGDMDVPGAGSEDTDRDLGDDDDMDNGDGVEDLVRRLMAAVRGESAEPLEDVLAEARSRAEGGTAAAEAASTADPAATPEAASQETEAPMPETTIQEAATATAAPSLPQADVAAAVAKALGDERAARKARKQAKKAKAAETVKPPAAPVAESAPAQQAAPSIEQLVAEGIKAAMQEQGLAETTEQKVARLVAEGVTQAKQEITAAGAGPSRKGLVAEHSAARPATEGVSADYPLGADGNLLPMERWSEPQRRAVGQVLQQTFLGSRAEVL